MTTREEVIAAAKEAKGRFADDVVFEAWLPFLTRFYAIAFEAGRKAAREECAKAIRARGAR